MRLPSGVLPLDLQTAVPRVIRNVSTSDRLPGTLSCEEVPAPALASHGVTCAHVRERVHTSHGFPGQPLEGPPASRPPSQTLVSSDLPCPETATMSPQEPSVRGMTLLAVGIQPLPCERGHPRRAEGMLDVVPGAAASSQGLPSRSAAVP